MSKPLKPTQDDPLVIGGHVINEYPPPFEEGMVENFIQSAIKDAFAPSVTEKQLMKFETRTFINGIDASTMTDAQIFEEIRRAINKLESLRGIESKPTKLRNEMERIFRYVVNLATYVDERD